MTGLSAGFLAKDSELPEAIQWLAANPNRSTRVFDAFRASFNFKACEPNQYHFAMLRSSVDHIWTSNYDGLFEKAATVGGFDRAKIILDDKTLLNSPDSGQLVIKMNGDFDSADYKGNLDWGLVFLQEHFDRAEVDRGELWRQFEEDYRQRSIIFVGLSFRDPVLRRILALARQKISRTRHKHYLLAKRETNLEARVKQAMLAEDLERSHIITIFRDSYPEILDLVQRIALASYGPIIGFSGDVGRVASEEAARDEIQEGMKITPGEVARVCEGLAAQLARRKIRITSGGAPFVGKPAVEAAFAVDSRLARFYLRRHGGSSYRATAPAVVVSGDDYDSMRNIFIPELSTLIAIGGRPDSTGKSGTITEVEMAIERNIPVLLLTPAGGDVLAHYDRLMKRIEEAYYKDEPLKETVVELNKAIAATEPSRLREFAIGELPERIDEMMRVLMGANITIRHAAEERDW
ncbi:MAG: SIR2 family protein [Acidobacteria bacterium]|nr:SIR2 family protein [Acidobacteriota bacterium]